MPGVKIDLGAKLDHELHAHRPLADLVAFGHSHAAIDIATNRSDWPISDHGQRSVNVHSRSKAGFRIAAPIHALIEQPHAQNFPICDQRFAHRHPRPDLYRAAGQQLRADPLIELPDGKHQPVLLVQKARSERKLERVVFDPEKSTECLQEAVGGSQRQRTTAGAGGIEQIHQLLAGNRGRHRNLRRIEIREGGANAARACHHSRDAKADVIRAFVADDLQRHAGHRRTLDRRGAVVVQQPA